jgi:hypothetical protein
MELSKAAKLNENISLINVFPLCFHLSFQKKVVIALSNFLW